MQVTIADLAASASGGSCVYRMVHMTSGIADVHEW
jgi:hypothetical protein